MEFLGNVLPADILLEDLVASLNIISTGMLTEIVFTEMFCFYKFLTLTSDCYLNILDKSKPSKNA